jgi:hypothetical protein
MSPTDDLNLVEVLVTVDSNNQIVISPDPVIVSVEDGEEIAWIFDESLLAINFSPASTPFGGTTYLAGAGGACLSGAPLPGTEGPQLNSSVASRTYKYTAQVTTGQGEFLTEDPRVIVIRRYPRGSHK